MRNVSRQFLDIEPDLDIKESGVQLEHDGSEHTTRD